MLLHFTFNNVHIQETKKKGIILLVFTKSTREEEKIWNLTNSYWYIFYALFGINTMFFNPKDIVDDSANLPGWC